MKLKELVRMACEVENRTEQLYREMSLQFKNDEQMCALLLDLADQEAQHAALIHEAMEKAGHPDRDLDGVDVDLFAVFFDTIDDVEDEVRSDGVSIRAALEILVHLERSVAEEFYGAIPRIVQGLPGDFVRVMRDTSREHMHKIEAFRQHCLAHMDVTE